MEAEHGVKRELVVVLGSLILASFGAGLAYVWIGPSDKVGLEHAQGAKATTSTAPIGKLETIQAEEPVAEVARGVPAEVLKTSTTASPPIAPKLKLFRIARPASPDGSGETDWEERRAIIEDSKTGDARAYAIGDLLPHGALLVGVMASSVDVMVGDAQLLRLHLDGRVEPLEDLAALAAEPSALRPIERDAPVDGERVRLALLDLDSEDPSVVQGAIDRLITAGEPAIELLLPQVESEVPVQSAEYAFPSGSQIEMRPEVLGQIVMLILEQITGTTHGDLAREDLSVEERRRIARAWRRSLE